MRANANAFAILRRLARTCPDRHIGMNDSVAMLSISTQSRTKHGNSCKVFSGAPNTLVGGGRISSAQRIAPPRRAIGGPDLLTVGPVQGVGTVNCGPSNRAARSR